jgi:hypothetical protein
MNDEIKFAANPNCETDFIDEIAKLLPPEQRPSWYRDMAHLRRLPADDELLRIARAMGFLALITRQAPVEIASEREKLAVIVQDAVSSIGDLRHDTATFHQEIENRLAQLPKEVGEGVNPTAIATILAESLRQQFMQSGLPETAKALALIAKQSEQAATEFDYSSRQVIENCRSTTKECCEALGRMRTMIQITSEEAKEGTQLLRRTFLREYKWSVLTLCTTALMLGFSLGITWQHWREKPPQVAPTAIPVLSQTPMNPPPASSLPHAPNPHVHARPAHETTRRNSFPTQPAARLFFPFHAKQTGTANPLPRVMSTRSRAVYHTRRSWTIPED